MATPLGRFLGIFISQPQENVTNKESFFDIAKIEKNLGNLAKEVKKCGISATGISPLPISSRWIVTSFLTSAVKTPITIIKSGSQGIDQLKKNLAKDWDWSKGIKDTYIDLEKGDPDGIVKSNIQYAAYMYKGANDSKLHKQYSKSFEYVSNAGQPDKYKTSLEELEPSGKSTYKEGENGILYTPQINNYKSVPKDICKNLNQMADKFKEMGFKVDGTGNFYDTKTGSIFNLIYDKKAQEIIVCFWGLANEVYLDISDKEKGKVVDASVLQTAGECLGLIPSSSIQAIKMGKVLKEFVENTGITPVIVGHSHGGALAQAAGAGNGIKTVVFNPQPMGVGVRRYIGQSNIEKNADNITVFSGKGDWVGGIKALNYLAILWERILGMPVPRTIGNHVYNIPRVKEINGKKIEKLSLSHHVHFYTSLKELEKSKAATELKKN